MNAETGFKLPGHLDQSQYSNWMKCPAYWLERYVRQMGMPRDARELRDDAATIGSLTHAGLEVYERDSKIEIPEWAIEDYNPTPEAVQQALELLTAYALHGEAIPWERKMFEELLTKPVKYFSDCACGMDCQCPRSENFTYNISAKLDYAFYVNAPTEIRIGPPGDQTTKILSPGWWGQEYKTKSASRDRASWMAEWNMKAQADFQLLTLGEFAKTQPEEHKTAQGILVTVLEYTKANAPKRKCRGCGQLQYFTSYIPCPTGLYQCLLCGYDSNKLKPVEDKERAPVSIWRMPVERTPERLAIAEDNIIRVIRDMHRMVEGDGPAWNTTACTSFWGMCEYFTAHQNWRHATPMDGYVQIDTMKYLTQGKEDVVSEVE